MSKQIKTTQETIEKFLNDPDTMLLFGDADSDMEEYRVFSYNGNETDTPYEFILDDDEDALDEDRIYAELVRLGIGKAILIDGVLSPSPSNEEEWHDLLAARAKLNYGEVLLFSGNAVATKNTRMVELIKWIKEATKIRSRVINSAVESGWQWQDRSHKMRRGQTIESLLKMMDTKPNELDSDDKEYVAELVGNMIKAYDRHANTDYDSLMDNGVSKDQARMDIRK